MSKYTTEIRFICENYAGLTESQGYANINDIINKAAPKVFDFDFPIFDEGYRATLENKILKHYYTREIGFETVGLWKHFLDMRLNEIMPYYNQLYRSETLEFNPFYDFDYTTKADRNVDHNEQTTNHNTRTDNLDEATTGSSTRTDNLNEDTTGTSKRTDNLNEATTSQNTRTDDLTEQSNSNGVRTDNLTEVADSTGKRTDNLSHHDQTTTDNQHIDKYSDTPQGALTNVEQDEYLTNARMVTDASNEINNGTNTGTVDTTGKTTTTNTGSQSNDVDTTTTNTGTQSNSGSGSKANTGTQDIDTSGNKKNTGTQKVDSTGDRKNTGTQDNDGNGTRVFSNTDDFLEHVAGKRNGQSYSKLLNEYRETFLNIDRMIIEELGDLFMNLW